MLVLQALQAPESPPMDYEATSARASQVPTNPLLPVRRAWCQAVHQPLRSGATKKTRCTPGDLKSIPAHYKTREVVVISPLFPVKKKPGFTRQAI
jgi:hypothetical protein